MSPIKIPFSTPIPTASVASKNDCSHYAFRITGSADHSSGPNGSSVAGCNIRRRSSRAAIRPHRLSVLARPIGRMGSENWMRPCAFSGQAHRDFGFQMEGWIGPTAAVGFPRSPFFGLTKQYPESKIIGKTSLLGHPRCWRGEHKVHPAESGSPDVGPVHVCDP